MRLSLSLVIVTAWLVVPIAQAQTVATQPVATQSPAVQPAVAPLQAAGAARSSGRPASRHPPSHRAKGAARRSETASTSAGVALGATDITGNKELPKVMVIVPWKDSLGAGGVVKPTDSLLDQVLQPVDRGVFQRQIHYYGQLNAAQQRPAAAKVAPVGDSH
jgi:hypothetical protein